MAGPAPDADGTRLTAAAGRLRPASRAAPPRRTARRARSTRSTPRSLFADISGFTKLSERLARRGREGAEELVEAIGTSLQRAAGRRLRRRRRPAEVRRRRAAAALRGRGPRSPARAASALGMRAHAARRRAVEHVGRQGDAADVAGRAQRRVPPVPRRRLASRAARRGAGGDRRSRGWRRRPTPGEIVVSPRDRARCSPGAASARQGTGPPPAPRRPGRRRRARRQLDGDLPDADQSPRCAARRRCARTCVAERRSARAPQRDRRVHRASTGTDALIARARGPRPPPRACTSSSTTSSGRPTSTRSASSESDVDVDGGKLMLTAGAPRIVGDDEERMLLALRRVVEGERRSRCASA